MKKSTLKKGAIGLLIGALLGSVVLTMVSPSQLQGDVIGDMRLSSPQEIIEELVKRDPVPGTDTLSAFQITDILGVDIRCPKQVDMLSQLQDLIRRLRQSTPTIDTNIIGGLGAESDIGEITRQIEQILKNIYDACFKEDANIVPEYFDVRFMEDYIAFLVESAHLRDCLYRDAYLSRIERITVNIKAIERNLAIAKEKGDQQSIETLERDLRETHDLLKEVIKEFLKDCPEDEASSPGDTLGEYLEKVLPVPDEEKEKSETPEKTEEIDETEDPEFIDMRS